MCYGMGGELVTERMCAQNAALAVQRDGSSVQPINPSPDWPLVRHGRDTAGHLASRNPLGPGPPRNAGLAMRPSQVAALLAAGDGLRASVPAEPSRNPFEASAETSQMDARLGQPPAQQEGIRSPATLRHILPKLVVGQINDPLENEADRIADQVIRTPEPQITASSPQIGGKCSSCEVGAQQLWPRPAAPGTVAAEAPSLVNALLGSPGRPLEAAARGFMEPRLGHDLSDVRIHTGPLASRSTEAVAARAYTVGRNVVFRNGEYAPDTVQGRRLLAHELAHVLQQRLTKAVPKWLRPSRVTAGGSRVQRQDDAPQPNYSLTDYDAGYQDATTRSGPPGPGDHSGQALTDDKSGFAAGLAAAQQQGTPTLPAPAGRPGWDDAGMTIRRTCDCDLPRTGQRPDHGRGEVLRIQRFSSAEHVRLGNEAESGQNVLVTEFGSISYGEMIALGDYFSSVSEIESLAGSPDGRAQISYALWKVNPAGRPRPASNPTAEQEVEDRYNRLAAHNEAHFSTGSSAGNSNQEQYVARHREALRAAWFQGLNPLVVRASDWQAQEAFAAHFLTDAFSAGHVRTQRGAIQQYWEGLYPNFRQDLVTTIACYMASYINDRDTIGWLVTVDLLTSQIAEKIRAKGGTRLSTFSIGDLISKVLHDADNAGLDVVSRQSPGGTSPIRWRAVGDEFLFPSTPNAAASQTVQFAETAIRLSFAEGKQAEQAGRAGNPLTPLLDESSFRALGLLPTQDPASSTNPSYVWRVSGINALPPNIQALIRAAFDENHEVRNGLDAMDNQIDEITTFMGFDLHTGEAWRCFKRILLHDVLGMLAQIGASHTCPPGKENPCQAGQPNPLPSRPPAGGRPTRA